MENAKKFFEEIIKTEEAKALFDCAKKPETEDERIEAYVDIAAQLGIEITKEEVLAYFDEKLNNSTSSEIDDDEMAHFSGGRDSRCINSYKDRENCWWNDGCDYVTNNYIKYMCDWSDNGACALFNVNDDSGKSNKSSSVLLSKGNPDSNPRRFG